MYMYISRQTYINNTVFFLSICLRRRYRLTDSYHCPYHNTIIFYYDTLLFELQMSCSCVRNIEVELCCLELTAMI